MKGFFFMKEEKHWMKHTLRIELIEHAANHCVLGEIHKLNRVVEVESSS
jgi:hypothetical protein